MEQTIMQSSMQLIFYAGNARSLAMQAIMAAEQKKMPQAQEYLEQAKEELKNSHQIQTDFMQAELNGTEIEKSIILIHSQDHFMAASLCCDMAERFIIMYEQFQRLEEKCL